MIFTKKIVGYSTVNLLVLYIATMLAPETIVFGNMMIGPWQAMITTALIVGIAAALVELFVKEYNLKLTQYQGLAVDYIVNAGILYILARTPFSKGVGLGLIAFWVALLLAIFTTSAQYMVLTTMIKKKRK